MTQNNIMLNGKKLPFSIKTFFEESAKITDYADYNFAYLVPDEYMMEQIDLRNIKPIVKTLSQNAVYLEIARCKTDKPVFVVTKDHYCISNNDELAVQKFINDPNVEVLFNCAVMNKTLADIFGLVHSVDINDDASASMGDVVFPEVATADNNFNVNQVAKGSGDEAHNFVTYDMLAKYRGKSIDELLEALLPTQEPQYEQFVDPSNIRLIRTLTKDEVVNGTLYPMGTFVENIDGKLSIVATIDKLKKL